MTCQSVVRGGSGAKTEDRRLMDYDLARASCPTEYHPVCGRNGRHTARADLPNLHIDRPESARHQRGPAARLGRIGPPRDSGNTDEAVARVAQWTSAELDDLGSKCRRCTS